MTPEKVLMRYELIIIVTRCRALCWVDGCFGMQSRKNNSENLTRLRGGFKTKNFKKIRKNVPQKHPRQQKNFRSLLTNIIDLCLTNTFFVRYSFTIFFSSRLNFIYITYVDN